VLGCARAARGAEQLGLRATTRAPRRAAALQRLDQHAGGGSCEKAAAIARASAQSEPLGREPDTNGPRPMERR
jgi:hypothetical protein